MAKKTANTVKCRFCSWSRPKFYTYRGRTISGFDRLDHHIYDDHNDQWLAIHDETLEEMIRKKLLRSKDAAMPADIAAYQNRP